MVRRCAEEPLVNLKRIVPGLLAGAAVMIVAQWASGILGAWVLRLQGIPPGGRPSPVSSIVVAIVLGMLVANVAGLPRWFGPGLDFGIKRILRLGIILVGLKLSFFDVVRLGAFGIPVVFCVVASALVLTHVLGRRLGVSDRLATLAAASTGICGVTATVAVAPTIEADDQEVAFTIANVTIFGVVAMFAYPHVAHALFGGSPGAAGLFLGTSIHETAQVMGAAVSYREVFQDEAAMQVATVTKLTRNVFLVAVVPVLGFVHARRRGAAGPARRVGIAKLFPLFVLGFLAMAVLRSIGDAGARGGSAFGVLAPSEWTGVTRLVGERVAGALLGTAMACVGLATRLSVFKGLGLRPLYLGALSATLVGAVSLGLAALVGPHVILAPVR
jgi:uncharacterized integral membrane protein (TIGR00698 family)